MYERIFHGQSNIATGCRRYTNELSKQYVHTVAFEFRFRKTKQTKETYVNVVLGALLECAEV